MLAGLEIGLLVAGLIALVTGKFKLGKDRAAGGAAARFAGLVLILPLPTAFAAGLVVGFYRAATGRRFEAAEWKGVLTVVELGLVAACSLLGFGVALAAGPARPPDADRGRPGTRGGAGPGAAWWLAGGLVTGFLLLVAASAALLWWAPPDAPGPKVAVADAAAAEKAAENGWDGALPFAEGVPPRRAVDDPPLDTPAEPPFAVDPRLADAAGTVYLRDMKAFDVVEGNDGWASQQVAFEGRLSPHALVLKPAFGRGAARHRYALGGRAKRFESGVGFTDDPNGYRRTFGPATFLVLGDGKELWRSKPLAQNGVADECAVDVGGVAVLELRTLREFDLGFSAPVWIEPRLSVGREAPPGARAAAAAPPAPRAVRTPLKGEQRRVDDLDVMTLRAGAAGVLPCLCWSADGRSFFYLDGPAGALGRVSLDAPEEVRRLEVGARCSWLSESAEGLLVTVAEREQVWVVDPVGLGVKARLDVPGVERAVSAPGLRVAFARGTPFGFPGGAHLYAVDLKAGTVARAAIDGLQGDFLPAWEGARVTADGKYLFTRHTELSRFRVEGARLVHEETGRNIVGQGRVVDLALSPDGRFVCLPGGGGNGAAGPIPGWPELRPYSVLVYPVKNLQRPAFAMNVGAYPLVVGFDPAARLVYAQNSDHQLMLFSEAGRFWRKYRISDPTDEVRQFLAHPGGRKLLLLAKDLYLVERGGI